jgi:trimethylamine--corrinoid protein Co-methyltransferase
LAGANLIYGLGMLESGVTFDFGQLVMDNDFARMIKYAVNGILVNDETLAVDAIKEVGIGKHFLDHDTTFKYMRDQSQPESIDRSIREEWEKAGKTDIYQRASEKARDILENHKPEPLPDNVLATMRSIVEDAEAEMIADKK